MIWETKDGMDRTKHGETQRATKTTTIPLLPQCN